MERTESTYNRKRTIEPSVEAYKGKQIRRCYYGQQKNGKVMHEWRYQVVTRMRWDAMIDRWVSVDPSPAMSTIAECRTWIDARSQEV